MPWSHCGQPLNDDLQACPACGEEKPSWTMRFNATRRLVIGGAKEVRLELRDPDGEPVAQEPYEVRFGDGTCVAGLLDVAGFALVEAPDKTPASVAFPQRERGVVQVTPAPEGAEPAAGQFAALIGRDNVFQLVAVGVEAELDVPPALSVEDEQEGLPGVEVGDEPGALPATTVSDERDPLPEVAVDDERGPLPEVGVGDEARDDAPVVDVSDEEDGAHPTLQVGEELVSPASLTLDDLIA